MAKYFPVFWTTPAGIECSGYIDCAGKLKAEFPHMRVSESEGERAFFADGSKSEKGLLFWGVMTPSGDVIAKPRFTSFKPFSEGRAVASDTRGPTLNFKFGYLNETAEWALIPNLLCAYSFSEGAAYIQHEPASNMWQLIDRQGNLLIDELALGGGYVRSGLARAYVPETKRFGFRLVDGTWAIEAHFVCANDFSEGVAAVLTGEAGKERLHFIDTKGRVVIEPTVYTACEKGFSEGLACVYRKTRKLGELAGYINRLGQEVIPCEWGLAEPFSEGLASVMDAKTRLWGFVDKNGKVVVPAKFGHVESFTAGLAKVRTSKRIGPQVYINPLGDVVWEDGSKPRS